MKRDMYSDFTPELSLHAQVLTAAANGDAIIDLLGYFGALIIVIAGTITDGTSYEFELKDGNNSALSDAAAVADANLLPNDGTAEPTFLAANDDTVGFFAYIGPKRYLRLDLKTVVGSPSTGGVFAALVVKGFPRHGAVN